jgi:spermidine/putrescine transport system permease protein
MRTVSRPLLLYAIAYVAFLYAPVLLLPLFSFNDSILVAFPLQAFTWRWYLDLFGNEQLVAAFKNSLTVAVSVAAISTGIGLMGAKALAHRQLPGQRIFSTAIMLPLVIPSIIVGISLLMICRYLFGIELSLWTVGAGHVLLCVPFAMLVMVSRLEGFDRSLEEASLDLGQGPWGTFRRIVLPLALPGVVASFLLCLTVSLDEFVLAFFLAGNDTTLPIYIFSQLRFPSRLPAVLALGSCILLASGALVLLAEWLRRRGVRQALPDI